MYTELFAELVGNQILRFSHAVLLGARAIPNGSTAS